MGQQPPPADQCWLWRGTIRDKGYGTLGHGGKMLRAHRVAYELFVGPIPRGLSVLHSCPTRDNPACVQPAHLRVGLHPDNMADAVARGSYAGEGNGRAKLTTADVRAIRAAAPRGRQLALALAEQYGVSHGQVYLIWSGKAWRHV